MSGDAFDADEILAAELAFGLLDADEAAAAERRAVTDPAFAALVAQWRMRAEVLFGVASAGPRPSLWNEIDRHLPANDAEEESADAPAGALRRWQLATAALGAIALALGVHAIRADPPAAAPPPSPPTVAAARPLVAVLRGADGRAVIAISVDRSGQALTIVPSALAAESGSIELWVIPADGRPRSLGLVAAGEPEWRPAGTALLPVLAPGATLAVTHEPRGGSPSGQPSGTPFLTGTLSRT